MLVAWDACADGIWWVSPKEEKEAPTYEEWRRACRALYGPSGQPPSLRELLSGQLLGDLKAWNDSCDWASRHRYGEIAEEEALEQQGRELAIRVQNELGTEGWEVLYHLGGQLHRVYPPGSWPEETWERDLLGYAPPHPRAIAEEEARIVEGLREDQPQTGTDGSAPAES